MISDLYNRGRHAMVSNNDATYDGDVCVSQARVKTYHFCWGKKGEHELINLHSIEIRAYGGSFIAMNHESTGEDQLQVLDDGTSW